MRGALALALVLTGCSAPSKEALIQSQLNAGMRGCDLLLADETIKTEPGVREWCEALVNGCPVR